MLAYVFWHWPRPDTDRDRYESLVVGFHAALARSASAPVVASWAVAGLPWTPTTGPCYADWYRVAGFADLDALNESAVTAGRQRRHDEVASESQGGAGGLYRLRAGSPDMVGDWEAWFAKPDGCSYRDLDLMLAGVTGAADGAGWWQRQLVLGPGREFCLVSETPPSLPPALDPLVVPRRRLAGTG